MNKDLIVGIAEDVAVAIVNLIAKMETAFPLQTNATATMTAATGQMSLIVAPIQRI